MADVTVVKTSQGPRGRAGSISAGSTSTLSPGEDATVTNNGTSTEAVFDFGIPQGDPLTFRGAWDNTATYAQSEAVTHSDKLWAANADTTAGEEPGVSSKWTEVPVTTAPFEDVTDHGATGDGTTDDTAAIQSAIDAANGKPVWFPLSGTYIVSDPDADTVCLHLPANQKLLGPGRDLVTIKLADGVNSDAHIIEQAGGAEIEGVELDGNTAGQTGGSGHCIRSNAAGSGLGLRHIRCKNARNYGIGWAQGGTSDSLSRCTLFDIELIDNDHDGIDCKLLEKSFVDQIYAEGNGAAGDYQIHIRGWDVTYGLLIAYNGSGSGIALMGNPVIESTNVTWPARSTAACLVARGNGEVGVILQHVHDDAEGEFAVGEIHARNNGADGVRFVGSSLSVTCSSVVSTKNGDDGLRATDGDMALVAGRLNDNVGYGFNNGGNNLRQIVTGVIARGNTSGQIRAAGTNAVHANNIES